MKIGLIGNGFVGSAVFSALTCPTVVADPLKNGLTAADLDYSELGAVFICVPTPSNEDGSVNAWILHDVMRHIPSDMLVIVKSTVTPFHLINLQKSHTRLVYNPEFLTQRSAKEDFLQPDQLIFGGWVGGCEEAHAIYLEHMAIPAVEKIPYTYTDLTTASMVKYTLNSHFATKVIFMNEIKRLYEHLGGQWPDLQMILSRDSRLGPSHLQVPGPDGFHGYGGACFPKDTRALEYFAAEMGVDLTVLRQAILANEMLRDE